MSVSLRCPLNLCMLVNFLRFRCRLLTFFTKLFYFQKESLRNTIRVSTGLDPDQDRRFVGPGIGQNCWQLTSKDTAGKKIVKDGVKRK